MERKFKYSKGKFGQVKVNNLVQNSFMKSPSSYFGETMNKIEKIELLMSQNYLPSKFIARLLKFSILLILVLGLFLSF